MAGFTFKKNVLVVVVVPSFTVTEIVVVPLWPAAGLRRMVRLASLPPKVMLASGTKVLFEELAASVRVVAAVSMSPIVTGMAAVETPSLVT